VGCQSRPGFDLYSKVVCACDTEKLSGGNNCGPDMISHSARKFYVYFLKHLAPIRGEMAIKDLDSQELPVHI
jgi:hypothetical protein